MVGRACLVRLSRQALPVSRSYCSGLRFASTSLGWAPWGRRCATHCAPSSLRSDRRTEHVDVSCCARSAPRAPIPAAAEIASAGHRLPRQPALGFEQDALHLPVHTFLRSRQLWVVQCWPATKVPCRVRRYPARAISVAAGICGLETDARSALVVMLAAAV